MIKFIQYIDSIDEKLKLKLGSKVGYLYIVISTITFSWMLLIVKKLYLFGFKYD